MRKAPSESNGFEGFFAEGLMRAKAAFHVRNKSMQADDAAVHEAVQAGAMAGAYAGAVAGAMAGALSARGGVVNMFRSPEKAQSGKHKSPPAAPGPPQQSRSGGHHAPPKAPEEPPSPQRVIPRNPSAGNVSTGSGEGDEHDLELELAKTLTIDEFISKAGVEQHIEEPKEFVPPPPKRQPSIYQSSLYEKNTDIEDEEEVDPRVGETLERMNNAGDDVNNKELELTKAKRALQRIPDEERKKCQDAYDKLPNAIKEILPYLHKQALVNQQQGKAQKAFVEYQVAHDAHAAAKAAVKAIEPQLMAVAGRSSVDTELLERYSDLMSKVVEAEAEKLKADKLHALEARRLANLLKELKESKQFITKEFVIAAQPYFAIKARAEDTIKAAMEARATKEKELAEAKRVYQEAMDELDRISQEIHEKRQEQKRAREREREKRQRESFDRRRAAEEQKQVEQAAEAAAAQIAAAVKAVMNSPQQQPPPPSDSSAASHSASRPLATIPSANDVAEEPQQPEQDQTASSELMLPSRSRGLSDTAEPAAEPSEPAAASTSAPAEPAAAPAPAPAAPAAEPQPLAAAAAPAEAPSEAQSRPLAHTGSAQYASAQSQLSDFSEDSQPTPTPAVSASGASFDLPQASHSAVVAPSSAEPAPVAVPSSQSAPDMFDFSEPPASTPTYPPALLSAGSGFGVAGSSEPEPSTPQPAPAPAAPAAAEASPPQMSSPFDFGNPDEPAAAAAAAAVAKPEPVAESKDDDDLC